MPSEIDGAASSPAIRVAVSAVVELSFALYVLSRGGSNEDKPRPEWVGALRKRNPALAHRVETFWQDTYTEWEELLVVAHHRGRLFDTDASPLLAEIADVVAGPLTVPNLPSERGGVREILQARLDGLRASEARRSAYRDVLREVWAALEPDWTATGIEASRAAAAQITTQLATVEDFRAVVPRNHFVRRTGHAPLVDNALANGEVTIVPLALAGAGVLMFALPGVLVVGYGGDQERAGARGREWAEQAAKRFKVLADPTRLSILASMACGGYSITDLAEAYDLSQPTVSVHVKILREAGLLDALKIGGQTVYRSDPARTRAMIEEALRDVSL